MLPHSTAPPGDCANSGESGGAAPSLHGATATAQERTVVYGHLTARLEQALRILHTAQLLRHFSHRETHGQYNAGAII